MRVSGDSPDSSENDDSVLKSNTGSNDEPAGDELSDEELDAIIKPELFTLNIPALLEILFGLFLFFVAIIKILLGWHWYQSGVERDLAYGFLLEGFGFVGLMLVSFVVAYGLILKKRFAPVLGLGKCLFFIGYFLYGINYYSDKAQAARDAGVFSLSDIEKPALYETNMYVNIILLLYVLLLTFAMIYIMYNRGYFDKLLGRSGGSSPLKEHAPTDVKP